MSKLEVTAVLGEPQYSYAEPKLFGGSTGREYWIYSYVSLTRRGFALGDYGSRNVTVLFSKKGDVESVTRGASTGGFGRPETEGPESARDRAKAELERQRQEKEKED